MSKNRIIFFSIFGAYHLFAFVFTVVIESNTSALFGMVRYIPLFKYGTLLGLLLIATDFIWSWRLTKIAQKNEDAARHENNVLKAKVYDFQVATKEKLTPNPAAK